MPPLPADLIDGRIIAVGSRSVVRAWGTDMVAKVPKESTPRSWIRDEARLTAAVQVLGVPAHRFVELREHSSGKLISVYQRVEGPTLWSLVVDQPSKAAAFGVVLAELQVRMLNVVPHVSLPRQGDRLRCKLRQAQPAFGVPYAEALDALPEPRELLSLCHGDLHPGNVIMSSDGPIVVDWFDACRGDAAGDLARTSLLLGAGGVSNERLIHLPGHTPPVLRDLHEAYLTTALDLLGIERDLVERWRRVEALARVAEGVDPTAMLQVWHLGDPDHPVGRGLRPGSGRSI